MNLLDRGYTFWTLFIMISLHGKRETLSKWMIDDDGSFLSFCFNIIFILIDNFWHILNVVGWVEYRKTNALKSADCQRLHVDLNYSSFGEQVSNIWWNLVFYIYGHLISQNNYTSRFALLLLLSCDLIQAVLLM